MRLFITLIFLLITLNAETTMCFKNNYQDISNIESQLFNGGKCQGKYSINDMVSKGWKIKDIKIKDIKNDSYNFIYILSQNDTHKVNNNNFNYEKLIIKTKEYDKNEKIKRLQKEAKKSYLNDCKKCHGEYGKKEPYGTSRAINTLSKETFIDMMLEYRSGDLDNGNAMFMRTSAMLTTEELDSYIYDYLIEINKNK